MADRLSRSSPEFRRAVAEVRDAVVRRRPEIDRQPDLRILTLALRDAVAQQAVDDRWRETQGVPRPEGAERTLQIVRSALVPVRDKGNALNARATAFLCSEEGVVPAELQAESEAADRLFHALKAVAAGLRGELDAAPAAEGDAGVEPELPDDAALDRLWDEACGDERAAYYEVAPEIVRRFAGLALSGATPDPDGRALGALWREACGDDLAAYHAAPDAVLLAFLGHLERSPRPAAGIGP